VAVALARSIYLPPWRIDITRRLGVAVPVPTQTLAEAAARALNAAGAPTPASLGLILSDDGELAALNAQHMGEHGPTDVLSFPMLQPSAFPPHDGQDPAVRADRAIEPPFAKVPRQRTHLGDIVISVERALGQAGEGRGGQTSDMAWSAADELRLLVTHGALHICGWDHALPAEDAVMRALERDLLAVR
jgi:probable rRNA maturation factor